jgi:hypothetical protein
LRGLHVDAEVGVPGRICQSVGEDDPYGVGMPDIGPVAAGVPPAASKWAESPV